MIERFEPNWLLILPVGKFVVMHIHWRGERLAGVFDTNCRKADVLYKSFVLHPNNDKHVENWLLIIKLYALLINVYLPVIVEYETVVRGRLAVK